MPKQSPRSAQNSPDGTTVPPAQSIRVLGSGLFTLGDVAQYGQQILLNGTANHAGSGQAVLLSWKDGKFKAQDSTGAWWLWTASAAPEGPQGSWTLDVAP